MSDDPFLAKPQEHMTPAEPSVQPTPPDVSAPAQYQPPQPPVPYQPGAPGGVPTPYAQAPYAQAHYPPAQPGYPPPPPVPGFAFKRLLRWAFDHAQWDLPIDLLLTAPPMRRMVEQLCFHQRGEQVPDPAAAD